MATLAPDPALDVAGLRVRRDGLLVLEDITFQLPPGSLTALVGPNGAGKSTLLQAIAGQLPIESGSLAIAGEPQRMPGERQRRDRRHQRLALMPQRSAIAWHFPITVRDLVALGLLAGERTPGFRGLGSGGLRWRDRGVHASGSTLGPSASARAPSGSGGSGEPGSWLSGARTALFNPAGSGASGARDLASRATAPRRLEAQAPCCQVEGAL